MVADRKLNGEDEGPAYDDGWWEAVLADEEGQTGLMPEHEKKTGESAAKGHSSWDIAARLFSQDEIVVLKVVGFNRGGLLVEGQGLMGFVPCSHLLDLQSGEDCREEILSSYVGRSLRLKIIECAQEEGRMVFSERAARAAAGKRTEIFATLKPGQKVAGEVTNVGGVKLSVSKAGGLVADPKPLVTMTL